MRARRFGDSLKLRLRPIEMEGRPGSRRGSMAAKLTQRHLKMGEIARLREPRNLLMALAMGSPESDPIGSDRGS